MESQRNFLLIALLVVTYFLYQQWQFDNAPVIEQQTSQQSVTSSKNGAQNDFIPESAASTVPSNNSKQAKLVTVTTDVLRLQIDTLGGDIVDGKLINFNTEQGNGVPFTVLQNGERKYIAQSGLTGAQGIDLNSGRPIYQTTQSNYELTGDKLVVDLTYNADNGLAVTKRFSFTKSKYDVLVEYIIHNTGTQNASVQMYGQLKQSTLAENTSSGMMQNYRGAAYSTSEDRYEKYDFGDIEEQRLKVITEGGWVAMLEHYFVSSWIPGKTDSNQFYSNYTSNQEAIIGFKAPTVTINANEQATTSAIFYLGPKDQDELDKLADNLGLTIDYGFLWMISKPLFSLLIFIQSIVVNWGAAIIVITLIVKGLMYPLTKAQYSSMAKMRDLQPKMAQLKERFGDDRQKMSQGMMELYKKEKVNPAGGCLPLLIQMPIFLALYWVFLESVELRHAPFILWIQDLSAMDPYFVLPLLMGISMFVMQKMQPTTVQDPMQQKVMQYMPVVFSVFMAFFPAGLVLYWLVSNIISIVQMKIIFKGLDKAKQAKA